MPTRTATYVDTCRTPACRTDPTPGYAPRGLCPHHEQAGLDAIAALTRDWADLQPLIWDKTEPGLTEAGGSAFGPSDPVNVAADALAREIAYTAVVWEIPVRERARLSDAPNQHGQPTGADLARAARILAAHYTALLALPATDHIDYERRPATGDGVDAVIAITDLHRRARSMIGVTARTTSQPGHCPSCGGETLRHRDGAEDVHCAICRAVMTWDDYQDAVSVVPVGRAA